MDGMRAKLEALSTRLGFRIGIAALLVVFHLVAFATAGHDRLAQPFNNSPDEAPFYSDPNANALGPHPRQPHHWSRLITSRWDAQHYIGFAVRGLSSCPTDDSATDRDFLKCGLGWLPAYGRVGGVIASIFHAPRRLHADGAVDARRAARELLVDE